MKLAVKEAAKGIGRTSPNPAVGAVVVKDGQLIAKGWHRKAGTPHAEVNALKSAGVDARGATIYVTLEPCNHHGRTPPCTRAILASGISRVVVGMNDPNPGVEGGGNDFLRSQGLDVLSGVLEEECRRLNRPFIKHIQQGLPWVILKAGLSLDGRIAVASGQCSWITNTLSRAHVHRLRDKVDCIMIGVGTALADDPSLTTRLTGKRKGQDPLRVVLDSNLRLSASAKMLTQTSEAETWIFCGPQPDPVKVEDLSIAGAKVIPTPIDGHGQIDLKMVLKALGKDQKNSVLVEGGGQVHGSLLRQGLVDQVNLFLAPIFLGGDSIPVVSGLGLHKVQEASRLEDLKFRRFGDDLMVEGYFDNSNFK